MSDRVDTLRREHRHLGQQLDEICDAARTIAALDVGVREDLKQRTVAFLRAEVVPHAWLDERVLYPEVTARFGDPLVVASMNYDHQAIRKWIDDIAEVDVRNVGRLQELLYGLCALITVHMWKEDELYLSALESPSWPVLEGS